MNDQIEATIVSQINNWEEDLNKRKQVETGVELEMFSEIPVSLHTFIHSQEFLGILKLSDKQYDFIKYGTQIYKDEELEKLKWEKVRNVGELVAWWGKSSGKDFVSQIIQTRIAYLLLCLRNPQLYYDLAQVSSIDMLNMAYNSDQAEFVFFNTFAEMIRQCRWFGGKYSIKSRVIEFDKRIFAYSGHSFEESFEGKNLIVAVLDEIAAFKTKIEVEQMSLRRMRAPRYSAESVYDMAKSSIESRFGNGIGKLVSLSFSRYKNDYIQQLYEKNKEEHTCYVSFGATWDINPYKRRIDFDDEFRKNPERAESRYANNPNSVEGGYFKNKQALLQSFPILPLDKVPTTSDRFPTINKWFTCKHTSLCSIHLDLGLRQDKAGFCMSHVARLIDEVRVNENGERITIKLPIVEIDVQTSFIAPINGEIDFSVIRQFIVDLIHKGFKVGKLTCDTFQSADFLQIIEKMGIETDNRSVDRNSNAYDCLKELIYDNRLVGYSYLRDLGNGVIVNEIIDELNNLILIGGKKVEHPAYGSKDVSDSVAGSVQGAIELGFTSVNATDIIEGSDREAIVGSDLINDREYLSGVSDEYFSG